jgi:hypothetical protein
VVAALTLIRQEEIAAEGEAVPIAA